MKKLISFAVLSAALLCANASMAAMHADSMMVGDAAMYPQKNIIENALNSTMLVAAVKAAGLVDTLQGKGPFTVFAKLPAGAVDTLLKPENKAKLTSVLTYHVVAGKYDMKALEQKIKQCGGKAELKTVNVQPLWIMSNGPHNIQLKDG